MRIGLNKPLMPAKGPAVRSRWQDLFASGSMSGVSCAGIEISNHQKNGNCLCHSLKPVSA
jgi:hypothetical protein